jgi:hypothetical protein
MHKSPMPGQFESMVRSCLFRPLRRSRGGRRRTSALAAVCLAAALACAFPSSLAGQNQQPAAAPATQGHSPDNPAAALALDLSDEVVRDVLTNFQRGIETHNLDKVLDVFDPDGMKDYAQFRDQMTAFFRLHDSIKFRYQLLQVTADKDQGSAVVDVDMDAESTDILPTTQRHSTQMRFQLKRVGKDWKVTGFQPADFFDQ